MNKDQAKGAAKGMGGKMQEGLGKLVGNEDQQVKGINKQITGKAQETVGDLKEMVKNSTHKRSK